MAKEPAYLRSIRAGASIQQCNMLTYWTMHNEEVQINFANNQTTLNFRGETKRIIRGTALVAGINGRERRLIDVRNPSVQRDMRRFHLCVDAIIPRLDLDVIIEYAPHAHATIAGHLEVRQLVLAFDRRGNGIPGELAHIRGYY